MIGAAAAAVAGLREDMTNATTGPGDIRETNHLLTQSKSFRLLESPL